MKNIASEFRNYRAFVANFKPVYIYHYHRWYFVCRYPGDMDKLGCNWIYRGYNKDEIEGWLYGCVQAANGIVERLEDATESC